MPNGGRTKRSRQARGMGRYGSGEQLPGQWASLLGTARDASRRRSFDGRRHAYYSGDREAGPCCRYAQKQARRARACHIAPLI